MNVPGPGNAARHAGILDDGDNLHPTTIPEGKEVGFISAPHFGHTNGSTS
jgi:hypothetical protein